MNLRDELQAIYDQHQRLTPALVVETARPTNHPLHSLVFDRSKAQAADAWYLDRAHRLIQRVRVTKAEAEEESGTAGLRRFHAVKGDGQVWHDLARGGSPGPGTVCRGSHGWAGSVWWCLASLGSASVGSSAHGMAGEVRSGWSRFA